MRYLISSTLLLVVVLFSTSLTAEEQEPRAPEPIDMEWIFSKPAPETIEELRHIQKHVHQLALKLRPVTVGLRIAKSQGSGVIVSPDGYVMTAGHVSGKAGRKVTVILHVGDKFKSYKGITLGANNGIDSGLVKITDKYNDKGDPWPYVKKGKSRSLKQGTWCMAIGHPGGYKVGRSPVVRLGRILRNNISGIVTDCTLVGGDSGGPLFDMDGNVIGINSRIGGPLVSNTHIPVDTYTKTWNRLAASEVWNSRKRKPTTTNNNPYLGVLPNKAAKTCKIETVIKGTPAEKAGVKGGDVIRKFAGVEVHNFGELVKQIKKYKIGDKVKLEVLRDKKTISLELTLGKKNSKS